MDIQLFGFNSVKNFNSIFPLLVYKNFSAKNDLWNEPMMVSWNQLLPCNLFHKNCFCSRDQCKKHFDFIRYGIKSVKNIIFPPFSYSKLLHKLSRYRYKEKDVYHQIFQIMYTITWIIVFFLIISDIFNVQHLLPLTLRFIKIMKFVFICAIMIARSLEHT